MSEIYTIVYAPLALDDIEAIYSYIAVNLQVPSTAEKQVNRIRQKIRSLASMPERCVRVDWEPWHSLDMRKMLVDRYLVFYRVEQTLKQVIIVRIMYAGRDIKNMIEES